MATYTTIHTNYGLGRIAAAEATGVPINLTAFAVGDGSGSSVTPGAAQTALVNERWRTTINRIVIDPANANRVYIEAVIPAATGGWTIREFGVFDDQGKLFTVGNFPATYKSVPSDGASNDLVIRVEVIFSNVSVITLIVDPAVAIATQAWVVSNITVASLIPGGTTGQVLRKKTNTNGDYEWATPSTANVLVDVIQERQTVASGQLTFTLTLTTTVGLAVFVEGVWIDKVAGATGWQQGASQTQVVLGKQYPVGSVVTFVQNLPAGQLGKPLQAANNLSDVANAATARSNLSVYSKAEVDLLTPPGTVAYTARSSAPAGWIIANGAQISRTVYSGLFGAIGTAFGNGDGSTTFTIPDLRGVFIRGLDSGRGLDVGRLFGSYQNDAIGSHNHSLTFPLTNEAGSGSVASGSAYESDYTVSTAYYGASETRPKNVALVPIIKY